MFIRHLVDPFSVGIGDNVTNPSVTVAQAFRRRNIASLRNLAHQTQMAITNMGAMPESKGSDQSEIETPDGFPLMIQGLRSNPKDSESHLLFLDTGEMRLLLL